MTTKVRVSVAVPGVGKQAILILRQINRNQGFLLQKLNAKNSASYWLTKCRFNDALMIDL